MRGLETEEPRNKKPRSWERGFLEILRSFGCVVGRVSYRLRRFCPVRIRTVLIWLLIMLHIATHDIAATAARPVVTKAAKAKIDCMWKL